MPASLIISSIVKGTKRVFDNLGKVILTTRLLFNEDRLEKLFLKRIKGRFGTPGSGPTAQHDPDGFAWKKLSSNTTRKANVNRSQKLVDFGRLRDSIGIVSSPTNPSVVFSEGGKQIIIGIRPGFLDVLEYAAIHNEGGRSIPQRRFLGIGKADELAADSLIKTVKRLAGLR